ncbi:PD40 domain-containing protein [Candidatus Bipolaricaulota bacterium]|nr:PD40 domain-containing protein [Candidatus Bipolaricaulota bacterium]
MPAFGEAAPRGLIRRILVAMLLCGLAFGIAACRGFFGQAPIALLDFTSGNDQEAPVVYVFDLADSNDPDGLIVGYELDYGDGAAADIGTDVTDTPTHTYDEAGTFEITLTVTDNDGRIGMVSRTITIGPAMITFSVDRDGSGVTWDYDIWQMKSDGSEQGAIYLNTGDEEVFPALVPTTRNRVAYASDADGDWDIFTISLAGGPLGQNQLTEQTSSEIQPSWSRNGALIAFSSNTAAPASTDSWEIWTMTSEGLSQAKLTSQSPSWAIAPSYSTASDDLLFVSNKDAAGGSSIWLWDSVTETATELFDGPGRDGDASPTGFEASLATAVGLPAVAGISKPVWSPTGTEIAFSSERLGFGGIVDIWVMDAAGENEVTLEAYVEAIVGSSLSGITTDDDEFCPFWLEDGSGLVFARVETSGLYNLYKVSFDDGVVTKLTAIGDNVFPAVKEFDL